MLDFVIFAVTLVVVLLIAVIYMYPSSKKITTIPGLDSTSAQDGNLVDIQRAGSLHEFLQQQHKELGPIVSFWIGEGFVVSIASPSLFKQHANVFDRPGELFSIMLPIFGDKSLYFLNGAEGRARRQLYDKSLSHENLDQYSEILNKISSDMAGKWGTVVKDEHISLQQYMTAFAIKAVLQCVMGPYFKDDKEVLTFLRSFDQVWLELEQRIRDPEIPSDDSPRGKIFKSALEEMRAAITRALEHRTKHRMGSKEDLIVDHVIAAHKKDTNAQVGDCLTYIVTGVSRATSLLTWCLYFLASHPEVQDKLFTELLHGYNMGDVSTASVFRLRYLREVIEETLRCAVIVPFSARCQDFDTEIGGHKIPKNTAVIQALGVVMHDEKLFPIPNKFDPMRFNVENSTQRDTLAYCPFGFGSKRHCPAKDLTYLMTSVLVATLIRKFSVRMVEGQVVTPYYGLVTRPEDEVWVTVTKRK
ncbi:cytochrome P450 20A1-like [Babylonia areolata]|uniref:cytochrome P450 20A1-like n=1 Tax=Babylonia areolata TaxID=304850 RepID=UPI003FD2A5AF